MTSANSLHPSEGHPMSTTTSSRASEAELLEAIQVAIDLLAERKQGSPARSAGHNARLWLEAILAASPVQAKRPEPAVSAEDLAMLAEENRKLRRAIETMFNNWRYGDWSKAQQPEPLYVRLVREIMTDADALRRIHDHLSTPDRTDELEREVERLREALEPFAQYPFYEGERPEAYQLAGREGPDGFKTVTVGDFRRARAALAKNGA